MNSELLIIQAERILRLSDNSLESKWLEAKEFLKRYGGKDNEFYKRLDSSPKSREILRSKVKSSLEAFIRFVENGLLRTISLEREIQIDTVSDFLEQAENLLNNKKVHPAAAAVLIGASLEEFCRNWLEEEGVDFTKIKMSLDSYQLFLI